ncbi:hypothetical protein SGLAM104S_05894 [Streptomyces glaucescens]
MVPWPSRWASLSSRSPACGSAIPIRQPRGVPAGRNCTNSSTCPTPSHEVSSSNGSCNPWDFSRVRIAGDGFSPLSLRQPMMIRPAGKERPPCAYGGTVSRLPMEFSDQSSGWARSATWTTPTSRPRTFSNSSRPASRSSWAERSSTRITCRLPPGPVMLT